VQWDELLEATKDLPAETEFELGGKKLTLSAIREATATQQKKLEASLKDAEAKRQQAAGDAEKAAAILNNLQSLEKSQKESLERSQSASPEDDWDTNNWWTPVRKRLEPLSKQNQELAQQVKQLNDALGRAAQIWAEDRWHGQYDRLQERLKKSPKHKEMSYEQVRDYAAQQRLIDSYCFPSVEKAILELTKEDDIERIRREAREEGMKEGMQRARLNATPRPTSASGGKPPAGKHVDPTRNLEDLGDVVMEDPELREMLSQVQGLNPGDIVQ